MKRNYVIYAVSVLAALASVLLLAAVYILKCPFDIAEAGLPQAERTLYSDGKMIIETDMDGFNKRASDFIAESLPNSAINEIACVIKPESEEGADVLYLNASDGLNIPYSFKCGLELSFADGMANVSVSDIRLGTYEIPFIGGFLWRSLKLPENVTLPMKRQGELRYLSSVGVDRDGRVTLTYEYDAEELAKAFGEVFSEADERKIEYHSSQESVDKNLLRMAETKAVSPDEAVELVKGFKKEPDSFLSLCYLLNEEGIRKLYSYFGEEYYKFVDADKLAEASENEIDSGLNEFHKRFSRLLLQYLRRNPDYTVDNGSLYLNGAKITPESVLSGAGGGIYDVEIRADKSNISAKYSYSGYETEKVIIKEYGK